MFGRLLEKSFQPMFGLGNRVPLIESARTRSRLTPIVERLETRTALAGNVAAAVLGGNLIITGNNQGVEITISQPSLDKITLTGNGTSINGSAGPVTFSGVRKDLRITLGTGDDSVTFDETNPITVFGNLLINGGQGSNTISTIPGTPGSLTVGGNLNILNRPGGTDLTTLYNLNVRGNVNIVNSGGNDLVTIDVAYAGNYYPPPSSPPTNSIQGNVQIINGPGQYEETDLSSIRVKGSVQVVNQGGEAITNVGYSGGTNTIKGDLAIIDGPVQLGQTMIFDTQVGHSLQVAVGGSGPGTIAIQSSMVGGPTTVRGGNGDDTVYAGDSTFGGAFQLQTGSGSDSISIGSGQMEITSVELKPVYTDENGIAVTIVPEQQTVFLGDGHVSFNGKVAVNLGAGDDTLYLGGGAEVFFGKEAIFDGQGGNNTAYVFTYNLSSAPTLKHFETGSSGCFVAGTPVATELGLRPIEEIRSGEKVYAYDPETKKWSLSDVIEPLAHTYAGDFVTIVVGSDRIKTTGNHPFWVISGDELASRPAARDVPVHEQGATSGGRWVEARDLRPADILLRNNGQSVRVENLYRSHEHLIVYNVTISELHNYSVGSMGVLVHNKV